MATHVNALLAAAFILSVFLLLGGCAPVGGTRVVYVETPRPVVFGDDIILDRDRWFSLGNRTLYGRTEWMCRTGGPQFELPKHIKFCYNTRLTPGLSTAPPEVMLCRYVRSRYNYIHPRYLPFNEAYLCEAVGSRHRSFYYGY